MHFDCWFRCIVIDFEQKCYSSQSRDTRSQKVEILVRKSEILDSVDLLFTYSPIISLVNYLLWWLYRYESEGKDTSLAAIGSGLSPSTNGGARSMYSDRVSLAHVTSNPSLGEDKVPIQEVG